MPHKDYKACGIFMLFHVAMNSQVHSLHHHHHHCHFSHCGASKKWVISCMYLKMQYYFALLSRTDGSFHIHVVFTWIKHTAVFKLEAIYLLGLQPLKQFRLISLLTFVRVSCSKMYTASCLCQMQIITEHFYHTQTVWVNERERERDRMDEKQNKFVLAHNLWILLERWWVCALESALSVANTQLEVAQGQFHGPKP